MKNFNNINESEKERILKLHTTFKESLISEQAVTPPAGTQPTTQPQTGTQPVPARTKNCSETNRPNSCNQKVLDVQVKLNDKCPVEKIGTKLIEDGIYGQKTQTAIKSCTGIDMTAQQTTTQQTTTQQTTTQPQTGAQPTTQPQTGTQPQPGTAVLPDDSY